MRVELGAALADFGKAIEVAPSEGWGRYHRGCMTYDARRWADAAKDLEQVPVNEGELSVYSQIRLYFARLQCSDADLAKRGIAAYRRSRSAGRSKNWQGTILPYLDGDLGEEELLAAGPASSPNRRCLATYYAAERHLQAGDRAEGQRLLQACLKTGQKSYQEYRSAESEVRFLGK